MSNKLNEEEKKAMFAQTNRYAINEGLNASRQDCSYCAHDFAEGWKARSEYHAPRPDVEKIAEGWVKDQTPVLMAGKYGFSLTQLKDAVLYGSTLSAGEQATAETCGYWQKCPKCDAQGQVSRPPYLPQDVTNWSSTAVTHLCDVCDGARVLFVPAKKQAGEQWVSVEERLPEDSMNVLGLVVNKGDDISTGNVYVCFYKKSRNLFEVWGSGRLTITDMNVTHWMPLPAPPITNK